VGTDDVASTISPGNPPFPRLQATTGVVSPRSPVVAYPSMSGPGAAHLRGWHPDPFGAHELRYFALNGRPTRLVRDAGTWSHHVPLPAATPPDFSNVVRSATTRPTPRIVTSVELPPPFEYQPEVGFLAESPWLPPVDAETASSSRRALVRRFIRYGSVSAISTTVGLLVLGILVGGFSFPAIWANVIATGIGTVPSFELNRRWVWAHNGQRSIRRQAIPYAICSFAGLVVSTFAVHIASDATRHSARFTHTVAIELAVLGSYGALWLIQFALCDRILFRSPASSFTPDAPEWAELSDHDGSPLVTRPAWQPIHA
jgi:putative flippase GtrA